MYTTIGIDVYRACLPAGRLKCYKKK